MKQIIAELKSLLERQGWAALTGPPGIGKSHLANLFAQKHAGEIIDVSGYTSTDEVAQRLARGPDVLSAGHASLRYEVLVVDNLRADVSAAALVEQFPQKHLIITTTATLPNAIQVSPLADREAQLLFESNHHDTALPDTWRELCAGNPAAILDVADLSCANLEVGQASLFKPGTRIRRAYDRAWNMLLTHEQTRLKASAVFESEIDDSLLQQLTERHTTEIRDLMQQTWYLTRHKLHPLAHTYLRECHDTKTFEDRFMTCMPNFTRSMMFGLWMEGDLNTVRRFERLWPVLKRFLHEWRGDDADFASTVVHIRPFLRLQGHINEHHSLVINALNRDASQADELMLKTFKAQHIGHNYDEAAAFARLETLSNEVKELESWRRILFENAMGVLKSHAGDQEGFLQVERSRRDAIKRGDAFGAIYQGVACCRLMLRRGEPQRALTYVEEAYGLSQRESLSYLAVASGSLFGTALIHVGEIRRACEVLEQVVELSDGVLKVFYEQSYGNLAIAKLLLGRFEEAKEIFERQLDSSMIEHEIALLKSNLAVCLLNERVYTRARTLLDEAVELFSTFPTSSVSHVGYAGRLAEAYRSGEPVDRWVEKLRSASLSSSVFLTESGREALLNGVKVDPSNTFEQVLFEVAFPLGRMLLGAQSLEIDGQVHSFARRPAAWNILLMLATSTHPVDAWTLIETGWPDEVHNKSSLQRLYITMTRLRSLGFGESLFSTSEGYALKGHFVVEP